MARGWESKSVEQQQEERTAERDRAKRVLTPEQKERERKKRGLELSRQRLIQQLEAAQNPRHREMLERAIADLGHQLSSFE